MAEQGGVKTKVSDIRDAKKPQIIILRTQVGTFAGEEVVDQNGDIIGMVNVCEMVTAYDHQVNKPVCIGWTVGDLIEFPEDYLLMEATPKSIYRQTYSKIMYGIETPKIQ